MINTDCKVLCSFLCEKVTHLIKVLNHNLKRQTNQFKPLYCLFCLKTCCWLIWTTCPLQSMMYCMFRPDHWSIIQPIKCTVLFEQIIVMLWPHEIHSCCISHHNFRESNGRRFARWSSRGTCSHTLTWPTKDSLVVISITMHGPSDTSQNRDLTSYSLRVMLKIWVYTVSVHHMETWNHTHYPNMTLYYDEFATCVRGSGTLPVKLL